MLKTHRGTIWMVAAALFFGATNISIKIGGPHLTVWQTAMARFAVGAAVVPILVRIFRLELAGHGRWLLLVRGASGTFAFILMTMAMRLIPLSMVMVLFYLWPVFTCLLSPLIAGEPTTKRELPFVAGALLGTAFILWPDTPGEGLNPGYLLALASSFFAGLAIVLIRRLRRRNNPFTIYFYFCATGGLLSIAPLLAQEAPILPFSTEGWLCLAALASFAMAGQIFMNQGMKYLNTSRTGALMMIEVIVAALFGAIWLGESLPARFYIGAILILGSGAAITAMPPKTPAARLPNK